MLSFCYGASDRVDGAAARKDDAVSDIGRCCRAGTAPPDRDREPGTTKLPLGDIPLPNL